MQFSSSLFVVSESSAQFMNGVEVIGNVNSNATVVGTFIGDGSGLNPQPEVGGSGIRLFVGSASGQPPSFDEWVTGSGGTHNVTLRASSSNGHLNHYTFIENVDGQWNVVSSGSQNGLVLRDYYDLEDIETGIYRYLVLGVSSASKTTVVKGTTITINPGLI